MRITFAVPGLAGLAGGLRVVSQYAAHLQAQGHQLTLAVQRPHILLPKRRRLARALGLERTQPLPAGQGYFAALDLPVVHLPEHRAVRAKDVPDADMIVSTFWTTAEWAGRMPRSKGVHVHFIQGYEDFHPELKERVEAVYRLNSRKIVVSGWLQSIMANRYGQNSTLVMNGVDTQRFRAPPRPRNRPPVVGGLYSSHPCKGPELAFAALARLREVDPDARALVFGTSPRPELPEWVEYERRPPQDRIPQIYAACDAWLFTSRSEGFGLPILEAMACRTPVIATPAGAAPDLIDGRNGRLVDHDPQSFIAALQDLLAGDWEAASQAAWETAQRNDVETAARGFEAALHAALQR